MVSHHHNPATHGLVWLVLADSPGYKSGIEGGVWQIFVSQAGYETLGVCLTWM